MLFKNALEYNVDTSIIYQHAKLFLDLLKQKSAELAATGVTTMTIEAASATPLTPGRKLKLSGTPTSTAHQAKPRAAHVVEHNIKRLFTQLVDYCGGEDDGKNAKEKVRSMGKKAMLSSHFMQLPSREELPDYYEKVKEPLDFNMVKQRVESNSYTSESDMVADCNKVLHNAITYYSDSSQLHKDAVKLQAYLNGRYQIFLNRQNLNLSEFDGDATVAAAPAVSSIGNFSMFSSDKLPKFADLKDRLAFLYKYIDDFK